MKCKSFGWDVVDANDVTGTLVKAGSQLFFCEQSSQIQYCQEHFTMWGLIPLVSAEDGTCLSVCLRPRIASCDNRRTREIPNTSGNSLS